MLPQQKENGDIVLDLHGLGRVMAKAAILVCLEMLLGDHHGRVIKGHLCLITGRGKGSLDQIPILKPFLLRLFRNHHPLLIPEEVRSNPGMLRITKKQLMQAKHQQGGVVDIITRHRYIGCLLIIKSLKLNVLLSTSLSLSL